MALISKLTAIADAVRSLTGTTAKLSLDGMADAINAYEPPAPSYDTPSIDVSTAGLITASANGKSGTKQLTTQAAKTVTPSTSEQTAVASGRYTTGAVKVAAVTYDTPSIEVSTGGLITASANGKNGTKQLTTKAAASITPTKSQQTAVASQTFTTGAVTVAAIPSQYIVPSGSQTLTENKDYDVTSLASVTVNVPSSGGGMNVQGYLGYASVTATSYTATAVKLTVAKTGTYKVSWMGWRSTNSGTSGSQLYINNSAYGSANTTFTNTYGQSVTLNGVNLTAGQEIVVRARARSTSYVMAVGNLIIEQTA